MNWPKARAFTLIELLVVIAIICLLLAIMAPTATRMMELGKRTVCENNHHMLAAALAQYTADSSTYLPFCNWITPEGAGWPGKGWLYWYCQKLTPGGSVFSPADREKGALYGYINAPDIYRCPMDLPPWNIGPTHAITSYLMNGAVIGYGVGWGAAGGSQYRVLDFQPTDIMFWEASEVAPYPPFNDGSSYPGEGLTNRHLDGATFGCVDGHTEYLTRDQFNLETYTSNRTRLWCNPAVVNGHY